MLAVSCLAVYAQLRTHHHSCIGFTGLHAGQGQDGMTLASALEKEVFTSLRH